MTEADPPKEANTVKKRSLLLFSNKATIYCLCKSLMLQIDPLTKSFSQKLQYPETKIKAINPPKKQFFGESSCSKSHSCKCKYLQLLF